MIHCLLLWLQAVNQVNQSFKIVCEKCATEGLYRNCLINHCAMVHWLLCHWRMLLFDNGRIVVLLALFDHCRIVIVNYLVGGCGLPVILLSSYISCPFAGLT